MQLILKFNNDGKLSLLVNRGHLFHVIPCFLMAINDNQ